MTDCYKRLEYNNLLSNFAICLNVDPSIPSPTYAIEAVSETLDQVVTEQPCIMKLDVEGYEPSVLKGAVNMSTDAIVVARRAVA